MHYRFYLFNSQDEVIFEIMINFVVYLNSNTRIVIKADVFFTVIYKGKCNTVIIVFFVVAVRNALFTDFI